MYGNTIRFRFHILATHTPSGPSSIAFTLWRSRQFLPAWNSTGLCTHFNLQMRLPALAIGCFQRQCQEDIDRIWTFMENRAPAELQSDYSKRILRGFRNTLWLQFSQMSRARRRHDPNDGDADTQTLAKLGTIVESTRVAVSHVLRISNDVLSKQSSRRPDASSDPNPYTSLSQFHRPVVPSTLPDPPLY